MFNKKLSMTEKEARRGFSFSLTFLIYSLIFFVYPLGWMIVLTFTKWNFIDTPKFVGFNNIIDVISNGLFWLTMWNTLKFMVFFLPMVLIFSFLFALGLKRIKFGKTFIALSFLVAQIAPDVGYSIVFSKILSPNGPINAFLFKHFNFIVPWLDNSTLAMFAIAAIVTWKFVGYYGLIFYAGMNMIPPSLYEAADIDGATPTKQFFSITLPLLNSQIVMVMVFAVSLGFGIFTEPYLITGGGPLMSTTSPMLVMYEAAFNKLDPSFSATMAVFTALIAYLVIRISKKLIEREVNIV